MNLRILSQLVQKNNKSHENDVQVPTQSRNISRLSENCCANQRDDDLRSCHAHADVTRSPKNGRRILSHLYKERTHVHKVIEAIESKRIEPGIFDPERDDQDDRKEGEKEDDERYLD